MRVQAPGFLGHREAGAQTHPACTRPVEPAQLVTGAGCLPGRASQGWCCLSCLAWGFAPAPGPLGVQKRVWGSAGEVWGEGASHPNPSPLQKVMEAMGVLAIVVNCYLIAQCGQLQRLFPWLSPEGAIISVVVLEVGGPAGAAAPCPPAPAAGAKSCPHYKLCTWVPGLRAGLLAWGLLPVVFGAPQLLPAVQFKQALHWLGGREVPWGWRAGGGQMMGGGLQWPRSTLCGLQGCSQGTAGANGALTPRLLAPAALRPAPEVRYPGGHPGHPGLGGGGDGQAGVPAEGGLQGERGAVARSLGRAPGDARMGVSWGGVGDPQLGHRQRARSSPSRPCLTPPRLPHG